MRVAALLLALSFASSGFSAELLVFTASWCPPCRAFKADYANDPDMLAPFAGGAAILDVDAAPEVAKHYNVSTVPAFLIVDGDEVLRVQTGYRGKTALKTWLQQSKTNRFTGRVRFLRR